jgi:hypothetical protein
LACWRGVATHEYRLRLLRTAAVLGVCSRLVCTCGIPTLRRILASPAARRFRVVTWRLAAAAWQPFLFFSVASSACLHACVYIGRAAGVCMREFFSRALATWLLRVYRGIGYLCMRPRALIYLISLYADSEESQQPLEYV